MAPPLTLTLLAIEAEFFLDREILGREGLVYFDQVDVIQRQTCPLECELRCRHRAASHQFRFDAGDSPVHDPAERVQIAFLRLLDRHHHYRCPAVDDSTGVSRRYRPGLSEGRPTPSNFAKPSMVVCGRR